MATLAQYEQLFRSDDTKDAYRQSIFTYFCEMLSYAEDLYGIRDQTYTILGIHIIPLPPPNVYHIDIHKKQMIIQIPDVSLGNFNNMLHLLAHETFHCLRPLNTRLTNRFEEGYAYLFAQKYMADKMGSPGMRPGVANYDSALDDAQRFVDEGGDLKLLCEQERVPFADLNADILVKYIGEHNRALAVELERDFPYQ